MSQTETIVVEQGSPVTVSGVTIELVNVGLHINGSSTAETARLVITTPGPTQD